MLYLVRSAVDRTYHLFRPAISPNGDVRESGSGLSVQVVYADLDTAVLYTRFDLVPKKRYLMSFEELLVGHPHALRYFMRRAQWLALRPTLQGASGDDKRASDAESFGRCSNKPGLEG